MPTIHTLGRSRKRTEFTYTGNVDSGVTLEFTGTPHVSARFFQEIIKTFKGKRVHGGFSMTDPTPGGLGEWIQGNSLKLNTVSLTPRHGSFIAAILVHEGYITHSHEGNAIILDFTGIELK